MSVLLCTLRTCVYSFVYVPSGHGCVHVCSMMMKMFRIHFGSSRSIDQLHSCTVPQCTSSQLVLLFLSAALCASWSRLRGVAGLAITVPQCTYMALPGHDEAERKLAEWMDEQLGMDTSDAGDQMTGGTYAS